MLGLWDYDYFYWGSTTITIAFSVGLDWGMDDEMEEVVNKVLHPLIFFFSKRWKSVQNFFGREK